MATPRTVGLIPRHRVRPALPKVSFSWSRLPTWPTVAMQSSENLRTSPEGNFTSAMSPSLLKSCAEPPGIQLEVVDHRAGRNVLDLQRIARKDVRAFAGRNRRAHFEPHRVQDV